MDSLKIWGVDYLKAAGFSFRSDDSMVASLLQFSAGKLALGGVAAKSHANDLSTGGAVVREWLGRAAS